MKHTKILIVDDSEINQLLMQKYMHSLGLEATCVSSGLEAIEQVNNVHYDVIFMDIHMPDMDGYEATMKIRENQSGKNIAIIAVTANTMVEEQAALHGSQMDAFLTKPVSIDDVAQILELVELKRSPIQMQTLIEPDLDIERLFKKMNHDRPFIKKIIEQFRVNSTESLNNLEHALKESDFASFSDDLHKLKGMALAMEAKDSVSLIEIMENHLQNGQTTILNDSLNNLTRAIKRYFIDFVSIITKRTECD